MQAGQFMLNQQYALYRRAGDVVKTGNQIILNAEIDDTEKLRQLLNLEYLKVGIGGVQGNYKLIYFLCEKQNIEQLIRYSIGVPESPSNQNESFKFPNVSQELICSSTMLLQAVVEGGFEKMFERAAVDESNGNPNEDDEDDDEEQYDEDDEDDNQDEDEEAEEDDREEEAEETTDKVEEASKKDEEPSKQEEVESAKDEEKGQDKAEEKAEEKVEEKVEVKDEEKD